MRFLSALISDARGKIGDTVFSRNPSGPYTRRKVAPAQPRTVSQQAGRALFATHTAGWRALPASSRLAWRTYANSILRSDSLGQKSRPSGFHAYLTNAQNAALCGSPFDPEAPTTPEITTQLFLEGVAEVSLTAPFMVLKLFFLGYAIPPTGALILQATAGLTPAINFVPRQMFRNFPPAYSGPGSSPDFAPGYLTVFPPLTVGQVVWVRARFINRPSGVSGPPVTVRLVTH